MPAVSCIGNSSPNLEEIGCVVMASGEGKRFGKNKLLAPFKGAPLIKNALDIARNFQKRVVVTRSRETALYCEEGGIDCVLHSLPYRSDTVRLGLEALGGVKACIFLQGDQALLRRETVDSLVMAWRQDPDKIWRPSYNGKGASPVIFPEWCFGALMTLPEGEGGGAIIKRYPERVATLEVSHEAELFDVDTREDLERLEKIHF